METLIHIHKPLENIRVKFELNSWTEIIIWNASKIMY